MQIESLTDAADAHAPPPAWQTSTTDVDIEEWAKRVRAGNHGAEQHAAMQQPPEQPQAWPSQASLYAQGLEHRAQTLPTQFAMDGAQWRARNFDGADVNGSTLRQRQADARKALMRTGSQQPKQ